MSATLASMEALTAAELSLAKNGRSFHWARRWLGKTHAVHATRLYAFCRHLDDLVDEATCPAAAKMALADARQAIESGETTDPVLRDGLRLLDECAIEPAIVLELIRGIASDLDPVAMADDAELLRYCYRVAGTVGLMMCRVLDVTDPAALVHAVDLGIAMQLTNISRDVSEDAIAGRRYLPATRVGDFAAVDLIDPPESLRPVLRQSLASLLDRADEFYQSGELGLPYLPLRARCGILVAARVYRAIGSQLRKRNCAYWQGRIRVSDWEKTLISAHALLTSLPRPAFWKCRRKHRAELHRHLAGLPVIGGDFAK